MYFARMKMSFCSLVENSFFFNSVTFLIKKKTKENNQFGKNKIQCLNGNYF